MLLGQVEPDITDRVPPRTPEERLKTLNQFLRQWAETQIADRAGENARPGRVISIMDSLLFGKKFFDQILNSTEINWEDSLLIEHFRDG